MSRFPTFEPPGYEQSDERWRYQQTEWDELWRERVLERDRGCCVHTNPQDCREWWQAHHVVPQQVLRQGHEHALWNPLAGMGVCGYAHRRHHDAGEPIPLWAVPLPVADFLSGLGFGWYLERHYAA